MYSVNIAVSFKQCAYSVQKLLLLLIIMLDGFASLVKWNFAAPPKAQHESDVYSISLLDPLNCSRVDSKVSKPSQALEQEIYSSSVAGNNTKVPTDDYFIQTFISDI